jgi:cytochrome P450
VADLSLFLLAEIGRRRAAPGGEDILSTLVHARLDDDETADLVEGAQRQLTDSEIISIVRQLLVAGNETTTNLLTQMMVRFAEEPEWWQRVRAEPELIPAVIEESLRLASPSGVNQRKTTREVELGGQVIPAGADVLVIYLSANHDQAVFPEPERFDPSRGNLGEHMAFGRGIHFCVGASLARLEARIALEELAAGVESFELVDPQRRDWNESFMLRAIRSLPIRARLAGAPRP